MEYAEVIRFNKNLGTDILKYSVTTYNPNIFKSKNYDVNSLKDINNNGELRYKVKMYIRNKKANK